MAHALGVLLGDDIGPEVVPEAVRVAKAALKAAGADVAWANVPIGKAALDRYGATMPKGTLEKLGKLDGFILGPIGHQAYPRDNPAAINPPQGHGVQDGLRPVRRHLPARWRRTIPT